MFKTNPLAFRLRRLGRLPAHFLLWPGPAHEGGGHVWVRAPRVRARLLVHRRARARPRERPPLLGAVGARGPADGALQGLSAGEGLVSRTFSTRIICDEVRVVSSEYIRCALQG